MDVRFRPEADIAGVMTTA